MIGDLDRSCRVGHGEAAPLPVAAHDRALLDQSAEPDALSRAAALAGDVGRRIEERRCWSERVEHQPGRDAEEAPARPITDRRVCLRVMAVDSVAVRPSVAAKRLDRCALRRVARRRAPARRSAARRVAVPPEHHIGTDQPRPAFGVVGFAVSFARAAPPCASIIAVPVARPTCAAPRRHRPRLGPGCGCRRRAWRFGVASASACSTAGAMARPAAGVGEQRLPGARGLVRLALLRQRAAPDRSAAGRRRVERARRSKAACASAVTMPPGPRRAPRRDRPRARRWRRARRMALR